MKLNLKAIGLRLSGKLNLLRNKISIRKSTLYSRQWRIPVIDAIGYDLAVGEQSELWLFIELQKQYRKDPFSVFIDIGVNVGQTLLKVKAIDPAIRYFGFEPNPTCVYYTEYLIRLNEIKNVSISCFGLGSRSSIEQLYFHGVEDTRATVHQTETTPSDLIYNRQIAIWTLDDIEFKIDTREQVIMKVDVEGYELEVMTGAQKFIEKYKPVIFFESLPHQHFEKNRKRAHSLFNWIMDRQYTIYLLNHDGSTIAVDRQFENKDDFTTTDFIARPN